MVVLVFPIGDDHPGLGQGPEAVDIEAIIADAGVERLASRSRSRRPSLRCRFFRQVVDPGVRLNSFVVSFSDVRRGEAGTVTG